VWRRSRKRYSLFGLQNTFAVEAFDEVPIPMTPEGMLPGKLPKLIGDNQGPSRVARGGYLLEAGHRVCKLRLIIGAMQGEGPTFRIPIELLGSQRVFAVECSHADAKVETLDVVFPVAETRQ
jgi:hypothetical protein